MNSYKEDEPHLLLRRLPAAGLTMALPRGECWKGESSMPWLASLSPSFFSFRGKGFLLGPEDTSVRTRFVKLKETASRHGLQLELAIPLASGKEPTLACQRPCPEQQTVNPRVENSLIFFLCQKIAMSLCRPFPFFLARAADA